MTKKEVQLVIKLKECNA